MGEPGQEAEVPQNAEIREACDHCGTVTEYVMWCCPNEHVSVCQPCYQRMVTVENDDPIHCPLRDYEVSRSDVAGAGTDGVAPRLENVLPEPSGTEAVLVRSTVERHVVSHCARPRILATACGVMPNSFATAYCDMPESSAAWMASLRILAQWAMDSLCRWMSSTQRRAMARGSVTLHHLAGGGDTLATISPPNERLHSRPAGAHVVADDLEERDRLAADLVLSAGDQVDVAEGLARCHVPSIANPWVGVNPGVVQTCIAELAGSEAP